MHALHFTAFLVAQGRRFAVAELSEAGLTLSAEALAAEPFRSTARGAGAEASIELYQDGAVDAYPVRLRLAGARGEVAEFAFSDQPPELRRRLRQTAAVAASPVEPEVLPMAFAHLEQRPAASRRLVLPGSGPVWAVTETRRRAFVQGPLTRPGLQALDVTDLARAQVGRYVAASGALLLGLMLLARLAFG